MAFAWPSAKMAAEEVGSKKSLTQEKINNGKMKRKRETEREREIERKKREKSDGIYHLILIFRHV